ncbi:MAG: acyl-CoA dehydrogenase family protein [Firmicutes bacterium]|nr:acyl-CoA dehydrogenase family protein [Bacillota bacterium]
MSTVRDETQAAGNAWEKAGAGFIVGPVSPEAVKTPEDLTDEQREIGRLAEEFVEREVRPVQEEIEAQNLDVTVRLLKRMGELGLLGIEVPEAYGGLGLDKLSAALVTEKLAVTGSFAVSVGAHTGIGSLPIVFFGNEDQRRRYLPDLASGRRLAAYALTEPGSGSDALGAQTTARLSEDGRHYLLRGQKQWITNSGFADVFVVYAKVDGEKFTAFIVDRDRPGLSVGPEVHKMGIKGSSTRMVFFDDTPVPVENVLGEIGRGHVIAFNILNIGRLKLGAGCVGSCKELIGIAARYAAERRQFGRPILDFPLIQEKLARMAARTYALESMSYRTYGLIDERLAQLGEVVEGREAARAIEEFALECSAMKVFGSEALDYVVDEAVQIHGGYGYMQEFAVERAYRDARIHRIFEGTNEINRMLIVQTLMRRAMKGLPVLQAAADALKRLAPLSRTAAERGVSAAWYLDAAGHESAGDGAAGGAGAAAGEGAAGSLAPVRAWVGAARELALAVAGQAAQLFGAELENEQEVLRALADMAIELYAVESALLRAEKAARSGRDEEGLHRRLATAYAQEAARRVAEAAAEAVTAAVRAEYRAGWRALAESLALLPLDDWVELRRSIARDVRAAGGYPLRV